MVKQQALQVTITMSVCLYDTITSAVQILAEVHENDYTELESVMHNISFLIFAHRYIFNNSDFWVTWCMKV